MAWTATANIKSAVTTKILASVATEKAVFLTTTMVELYQLVMRELDQQNIDMSQPLAIVLVVTNDKVQSTVVKRVRKYQLANLNFADIVNRADSAISEAWQVGRCYSICENHSSYYQFVAVHGIQCSQDNFATMPNSPMHAIDFDEPFKFDEHN